MSKAKDNPETKTKSGKKLLLMIVGALVLIGCGVGGGVYMMGGVTGKHAEEDPHMPKLVERSDDPEVPAEEGADEAPVLKEGTIAVKDDRAKIDPKKHEVTYIGLEQSFTANLADGAGFVQLGLSLATYYDGKVVQNVQRQSVPIRSAVLMVLSQQDAAVLSTPQGKQLLQRDLTAAINQILREKEGFGGIDNVYFTNLVIQ
jgi:flagellar protein FliL